MENCRLVYRLYSILYILYCVRSIYPFHLSLSLLLPISHEALVKKESMVVKDWRRGRMLETFYPCLSVIFE